MGAGSTQSAALDGLTVPLSDLVSVPPGANSAWVQGVGDQAFGFRLDGEAGHGSSDCFLATEKYCSNRAMIDSMVVCAYDASDIVVQFFTGRTGPAYR